MDTDWCVQIEPTQNPGRILLLTMKSQLEAGHEWLDDNLTTIFTQFLPKNTKYQSDSEHLIPTHADIRPVNAMLDNYAEELRKKITLQTLTQTTQQQFAHPPATRTPPLTTLSYSAAEKKSIQHTEAVAAPPKAKKLKQNDTLNTTEHSQDTVQTSTTTTTHLNLQTKILNTLRSEVKQMITTDLQPIQNELRTLNQNLATFTTKTTNEFQNIHQQLTANQDHFQKQMEQLATWLQEQQEHQAQFERQMQETFLCFSQFIPTLNSPSLSMDEEGMH